VNKAWKERLGYTDHDIESLTLNDIVHPYYKAKLIYQLRNLYKGENVNKMETVFLTKAGTAIDEALRNPESLERHELQVALGAEATLFTKISQSKVPWWIEFLDPIAKDDLKAPSSRTTSAVLVIRLAKMGPYARTVCFTFGYGRHLLDPARLERDFGLLLALNAVDPQAYLAATLTRLVSRHPASQIDQLMPWAYAAQVP
jgi:uncharacterized protein (TIGR04141 family)